MLNQNTQTQEPSGRDSQASQEGKLPESAERQKAKAQEQLATRVENALAAEKKIRDVSFAQFSKDPRAALQLQAQEQALTTRIKANPNDAAAYLDRSVIRVQLERTELAIADTKKVISLVQDAKTDESKAMLAEAYVIQGTALIQQGEYKTATAAFEQGLKVKPADFGLMTQLVITYRNSGNPAKAVEVGNKALELLKAEMGVDAAKKFPLWASTRFNIGMAELAEGKIAEARKTLELSVEEGLSEPLLTPALKEIQWIVRDGPDPTLHDAQRAEEIREHFVRPPLLLNNVRVTEVQAKLIQENVDFALDTIEQELPELEPFVDKKEVTQILVVPHVPLAVRQLSRQLPKLAQMEISPTTAAVTIVLADKVTGEPQSLILIGQKDLEDRGRALELFTHELRHVQVDHSALRAKVRPEADATKREIPVYAQTIKDLTAIRDAWVKAGINQREAQSLSVQIRQHQAQLKFLREKK